jgi:hypothetical protein
MHVPVLTSQSLIVSSALVLARTLPSGLKHTDCTVFVCPCSVYRHSPLYLSHSRIVRSLLPLARIAPSGLKQIDRVMSLCSYSVCRHSPLYLSHSRTVRSSLPLARTAPSGLKQMHLTNLYALAALVHIDRYDCPIDSPADQRCHWPEGCHSG